MDKPGSKFAVPVGRHARSSMLLLSNALGITIESARSAVEQQGANRALNAPMKPEIQLQPISTPKKRRNLRLNFRKLRSRD